MFLKCPVCQKGLTKDNTQRFYECENKHHYDISKYGYTNCLLANQIHSTSPGDSAFMIKARVKFLELDYYDFLRKKIIELFAQHLPSKPKIAFCDLACGEGYYTNLIHQSLVSKVEVESFGVDLSKQAIIEACKKVKKEHLNHIEYVIGNLMNLPFLDESFDLLLNCFAPMFEKEFYRILKKDGIFIRVLPAKRHLYELKEILYSHVEENKLKDLSITGFELLEKIEIEKEIHLKSSEEISSLFTMTPYYYKSPLESSQKLCSMSSLKTTAAFVLLLYKKRED